MRSTRKGAKTRGEYRSVAERAAEGEYELVDPLDYLILDNLPEEGTTIGGILPLGATVSDIAKNKLGIEVESSMISGRMVSLKTAGLAVVISMARSDSAGWQITKLGEKILAEWKDKQSNNKEGE